MGEGYKCAREMEKHECQGYLGIKTFSEEWSSMQIVTQNFRQIVNEKIPLGLVVR